MAPVDIEWAVVVSRLENELKSEQKVTTVLLISNIFFMILALAR